MPLPVTALEKRILGILALLIVLGLISMAVLQRSDGNPVRSPASGEAPRPTR